MSSVLIVEQREQAGSDWQNIWKGNVKKWSNLKGGIDRDKSS